MLRGLYAPLGRTILAPAVFVEVEGGERVGVPTGHVRRVSVGRDGNGYGAEGPLGQGNVGLGGVGKRLTGVTLFEETATFAT